MYYVICVVRITATGLLMAKKRQLKHYTSENVSDGIYVAMTAITCLVLYVLSLCPTNSYPNSVVQGCVPLQGT